MSNEVSIIKVKSESWEAAKPVLSILVPFFKDNPTELLEGLSSQKTVGEAPIEVLLYDDGTQDINLSKTVSAAVKSSALSVKLITAANNNGRSFARNFLQSDARADWLLFLDADMRPVTKHFLADYLALIEAQTADIIFGGFHVPDKAEDPSRELHRAFSELSDCLSLENRQLHGPQYVCSSNLCIRKSIIEDEPFDAGFQGWGWEDSEWAARAAHKYALIHADIPALHLGLETTETLLRRFKDSGPNYHRFTSKHPELAKTLTLYKVVQKLRKLPGQAAMRPILRLAVRFTYLPIRLRLAALKLWRASWYVDSYAGPNP